jgi:hypothetical protein
MFVLPFKFEQKRSPRHCEEHSDEAIQTIVAVGFWIASLRSQ